MARAQFKAPDPAELSMTSDPKAPGAAAVYLDREETTDADSAQLTYYARIKVLAEKGKELATVSVVYYHDYGRYYAKVKVDGRTIHADGTIVPLTAKPDDLLELKQNDVQENKVVFSLPSVEVGSVLEYRIQMESSGGVPAPEWELQKDYFVHQEHFKFKQGIHRSGAYSHGVVEERVMVQRIPHDDTIQVKNSGDTFTVDMTDVPPLPHEDWMPPIHSLRWRVSFYYTYAITAGEYWKKEAEFWKSDVENFAKVTGTLKTAAAGMVSPGDSEEDKARKIYSAVQKLDNTDFSRQKTDAERRQQKLKQDYTVEAIWKNQGGAGNSVALLYVALARAAGLKAWPMMVADRNAVLFDPALLSTQQLEDYIAVVNIGGKEVFLDPAQKGCPFGALHWAHTSTAGFRESDTGPAVAPTPAPNYKDNVTQAIADLTFDAEGNVKGTGRMIFKGAEALYWRQKALTNSEDEVRKEFLAQLNGEVPEGVEADFDHFIGLDDPEKDLMAVVTLSGKFGAPTGKRLILPGVFFETRSKHPFVAEQKRAMPVDLHYPALMIETVIYRMPPDFSVESLPKTDNLNWQGAGALQIGSSSHDNVIEVNRTFARNFTYVAPRAYDTLHDFYGKIAAADQQQIVLIRAATAKGN